jgi:hypothetical protein
MFAEEMGWKFENQMLILKAQQHMQGIILKKKSGLLNSRSPRHRTQSPEVIHVKSLWALAIT